MSDKYRSMWCAFRKNSACITNCKLWSKEKEKCLFELILEALMLFNENLTKLQSTWKGA